MANVLTDNSGKCAIVPNHLGYASRVNFGSYYTAEEYISIVWDFIRPLLKEGTVVLDSSCGYGNFLRHNEHARVIGNDIDTVAAETAKRKCPFAEIRSVNALTNLQRKSFGIPARCPLIIIGNPPYNDTSSIIRNGIKQQPFEIHTSIYSRDLGMSFLLSYQKLEADYICVLHPLSYLIKKANFASLKAFTDCYKLIDGLIISSGVFAQTSKFMQFPIIIALYAKHLFGMDYNTVERYVFKTIEGKSFAVRDLDFIGKYLNKYPSKKFDGRSEALFFYTMRDLNALKRNQTFIKQYCSNAIVIDRNKLDYYVYVDVVKDFANVFPYYFGNFDVLINQRLFSAYMDYFISYGLTKHSFLKSYYEGFAIRSDHLKKITEYFTILLGEHYVKGRDH